MSASSPFWDTDPFRIGQRYRTEVRADGRLKAIPVPLTEEDFLYPQPDDQFTGNVQHGEAMWYLYHAVGCGIRGRAGFRCFTRLSLDWQRAGMRPNAPDVSVFEDFVTPFATNRHTLPVLDSGAKPVLVIEVTVPSTRHLDLEVKWAIYHAAGVPYYLVFDWPGDARGGLVLLGYRWTEREYVPLQLATHGVWIDPIQLWIGVAEGKATAHMCDIYQIPPAVEMIEREVARKRAAAAEKARADAAQQQMDALARELADLKARLAPQG